MQEMEQRLWPETCLPDLLAVLLEKAALLPSAANARDLQGAVLNPAEWIPWAARSVQCEAERTETTLSDFEDELPYAYPAVLKVGDRGYLPILAGNSHRLQVLTPDGAKTSWKTADVYGMLCHSVAPLQLTGVERLLNEAEVSPTRRKKAARFLLREQLTSVPFQDCWVFRPSAGAAPRRWLSQAGIVRHGRGLIAAHTLEYLLWIVSWAMMGQLSFEGHFGTGWRMAWALLLLTLIPLRLLATWKQGLLVVGFGGLLKRRLLHGALQLGPEEMRHSGIGHYMSQALEAESMQSLALSGGVGGALSLIELAMAALILGPLAPVILAWFVLTGVVGWRFFRRYQAWTGSRLEITGELVESMVGQRTRLAQQRRDDWHQREDQALQSYAATSRSIDRLGNWLTTAIPRGWLVISLVCFAPSVLTPGKPPAQLAVTLGGILLAYTGFKRLTGSSTEIAVFFESFRRVRNLFQAAARTEPSGESMVAVGSQTSPGERILEAEGIGYRYRSSGAPVLESASLTIARGDRILLEGPSGGGKTTFASILSGMREPQTGLLLANGLDRHAIGPARWRKLIATAPQFHENHIFTETLAFNLLMGRTDLPAADDLTEAEEVCRELGLGDLLDRMPAGLLQMVGEGGWQLSHGERSRVFIARALLQRSDLVILDESFGALDPENLQLAMECTLRRAETLMVIAHP